MVQFKSLINNALIDKKVLSRHPRTAKLHITYIKGRDVEKASVSTKQFSGLPTSFLKVCFIYFADSEISCIFAP